MINLFVTNNYHTGISQGYLCIYKIWTWISLTISKSNYKQNQSNIIHRNHCPQMM